MRRGIDHGDVVALPVRHVDARQRAGDRRAQLARRRSRCRGWSGSATRRHAGHRLPTAGGRRDAVRAARPPADGASRHTSGAPSDDEATARDRHVDHEPSTLSSGCALCGSRPRSASRSARRPAGPAPRSRGAGRRPRRRPSARRSRAGGRRAPARVERPASARCRRAPAWRAELAVAEPRGAQRLRRNSSAVAAVVLLDACARTGVAAHSRFSRAATAFWPRLVAAVVAEQHDVAEAVQRASCAPRPRAALLESVLRDRDRAREAHVPGRRRDRRLPARRRSPARPARCRARAAMRSASTCARDVVLAERHVRAVLLGAADRDDDRGLAGRQRVAHLGPGQLLELDAGRRGVRQAGETDGGKDGEEQGAAHAAFYAKATQAASAARGAVRR